MRRIQLQGPHVLVGLIVVAAAVAVAHHAAANAPAGRYTITNGGTATGTVLDNKTGLTWQQAMPAQGQTWSAAGSYCSSNTAGLPGGPWRLPNLKELQTIVDESQSSPAVDPTAFPGVNGAPQWAFWTSSPVAGSPSAAWIVNFYDGYTANGVVTSSDWVRCVR